ncbi:MAG: tetratricopeptide repeat protein [Phycisphaerales bacterium]
MASSTNSHPPALASTASQVFRVALIGAGLLLAGWAFVAGVGCTPPKHGNYTKEGKNLAKERIDALKGQTEYQMAMQSFLDADLEKAGKHIEKAMLLAPKVASVFVLRGRIMLEKSDIQQAQASFAKAKEIDPAEVEAYYYSGILSERITLREEALENYRKANELDPEKVQYPIAAADMMIELGRVDEAEQYLLQQQVQLHHTAGVQQMLGKISVLRGDNVQAEKFFTEARILASDETSVLEDLARAQFNLAKWGEAESNLARLLRSPEYTDRRDLAHMRAKCLNNLNRNAEARDLLVTLTKGDIGQADVEAWISLGQVAYTLGDWSRVRQSFVRTISLAPERPEGYILRGLHQRRTNDLKGAEQSFRKAIDISPSAENYIILGLVYQKMHNEPAAKTCFAKASALDPKDEVARQLVQDPSLASKIAGVSNE